MFTVTTYSEAKRGCGYRGAGGTYIVGGELNAPCGKLPKVLDVCPTCHAGWKPTRSWTWIDLAPLFPDGCCNNGAAACMGCPLRDITTKLPEAEQWGRYRAGLIWIGEKFYPTPEDFLNEARTMGISRRLPNIPNGFVAGETLVLFAHRKAIPAGTGEERLLSAVEGTGKDQWQRAIVAAFIPRAVQYVVKDADDVEKLEKLAARGVELVRIQTTLEPSEHGKVVMVDEWGTMPEEAEALL